MILVLVDLGRNINNAMEWYKRMSKIVTPQLDSGVQGNLKDLWIPRLNRGMTVEYSKELELFIPDTAIKSRDDIEDKEI